MVPVHVIGGGLAGVEAAWQLAVSGIPVCLHEMRPHRTTEAHLTDRLAELVCSNSLRSSDAEYNAVGLLHEELRQAGSLVLATADRHKIPAGGALAVDREGFSQAITQQIVAHPLICVVREEITVIPPESWGQAIVASGPLTSQPLARALCELTGEDSLSFFDAIAPIVYRASVDESRTWFQSRYDKGGPSGNGCDYINCPFERREEYYAFVEALLAAQTSEFREWEKNTPYFEACLPIEVMAARGKDTLRFGPMKPVGLEDPRTERRPFAVVQLRQDNALGTLYNMVGCQTKLKYAEQARVFRLIPGLEKAEFARLGGLHRNIFINSPRLLDPFLRLKTQPRLRFAGQITGVEGYVESAAIGLLAGRFAAAEQRGQTPLLPPRQTAFGALLTHITEGAIADRFQPMNINFGLFSPIDAPLKGRERKAALSRRALHSLQEWL